MNRGSPRPRGGFYTPPHRPQGLTNDQRNTVNIPFYRDSYHNTGSTPQNFNPRRGGRGGGRFHNNNSFTPRHNRPHFQQQQRPNHRENVDISQFFHPAMLQDPWAEFQTEADTETTTTARQG